MYLLLIIVYCTYCTANPVVRYESDWDSISNEHLKNAYTGKQPMIVQHMESRCLPELPVENDAVYLETYDYSKAYFNIHFLGNYAKDQKDGFDILHKDQLIPYSLYQTVPDFIYSIEEKQEHMICNCKGTRYVEIMTKEDSKKLLYNNHSVMTRLSVPKPIYLLRNMASNYPKYRFTLHLNECLIFNPYVQFHTFFPSKNSEAIAYFKILGYASSFITLFLRTKREEEIKDRVISKILL